MKIFSGLFGLALILLALAFAISNREKRDRQPVAVRCADRSAFVSSDAGGVLLLGLYYWVRCLHGSAYVAASIGSAAACIKISGIIARQAGRIAANHYRCRKRQLRTAWRLHRRRPKRRKWRFWRKRRS